MARDGNGVYRVPNPIVIGAIRSSAAVNQNFLEEGDELTNTLPVDGRAGMSGQCKLMDGSPTQPGLAFSGDVNTGLYRSNADEMTFVTKGVDRLSVEESGRVSMKGALYVAASLNASLGPQAMVETQLRRTENAASAYAVKNWGSGSGANPAYLQIIGGASNNVVSLRWIINASAIFTAAETLFTHDAGDVAIGSSLRLGAAGYVDAASSTPSVPPANVVRLAAPYCRTAAGTLNFIPPVDHQVFTASGQWFKPTGGQTMARIEVWSGGGSGSTDAIGYSCSGGGGGSYNHRVMPLSALGVFEAVTVGEGGAPVTGADQLGLNGGDSSFGSHLVVYGGAGSWVGVSNNNAGGSGGGLTGPGENTADPDGGTPLGMLGSDQWGANNSGTGECNPFGGAAGGIYDNPAQMALFGGGGGGASGCDGGMSVFGGGGGAGGNSGDLGGTSVFGGAGGAAGHAGTVPGGGGGGRSGGTSGAGARGEVRVTCW